MVNHDRLYGRDEYEIVMYPKMNHVMVGLVDIVLRNFHIHREMEIGLVVDGQAKITVSNNSFLTQGGSLFFCNSNEPHEITAMNYQSVKIIYIQLANNFCQDYLHLFRNFELLENDLTSSLTPAQNAELTRLVVRTVQDYMDEGALSLLHLMRDLSLLFCRLLDFVPYRQFEESVYQAKKKKAARIHRITEYIDSHYSGKVSLSQLAASEGVSTSYLSHFFHACLGMSFQDYVNNVRLGKAIKLMVNTRMRLLDICLESGFSDMKYLNKMFERQFGCTAKEYSRNNRVEAPQFEPEDQSQNQHFVSKTIGLSWLDAFEKASGLEDAK